MTKKEVAAIIENMSADRKIIAQDLLKELVFMQELLDNLRASIREAGVVDIAADGSIKESSVVKSYGATVQRYGNLYKQLELMISKDRAGEVVDDALQGWLEASK